MRALTCFLPALVACSDYGIKSTDAADPGGLPALAVTPGAVSLGIVCGEQRQDVEVVSAGDGDLTVSALTIDGAGWRMEPPELPLVLPPTTSLVVPVFGGEGDGELVISSDDPDAPEVVVPLSATPDVAPTVAITSPGESEILGVGASTWFLARVEDDRDAPEALLVTWESDVDGALASTSADASGISGFVWEAGRASSGSHTITVTATDSCGGQASDSVTICQNEGYVEDSIDIAAWHFEGAAAWDSGNGWVELTRPDINQAGTAFQTSATVSSDNVSIAFQFYVSGGSGADGMSLTVLDTSRMSGFVGTAGGGIGYGGLPGWSIEIDTWYNGEHADPTTEDHLSVHIDGNVSSPVVWAALPEMEDGAWHTMDVSVSGTWMTVSIDGSTYIDQSISGLSAFPAYVGFTAATGSYTNYHLVDALQVEAFVCEE